MVTQRSEMLILPHSKLVIVHVPRTGGNALIRAIVNEVIGYHDLFYNSWNVPPLERHVTSREIRELVPYCATYDFIGIDRPYDEIVASDMKLWASVRQEVYEGLSQRDRNFVELARANKFLGFKRVRWMDWIGDDVEPWDYFCDPAVERIAYQDLGERWDEICKRAGCRSVPKIERVDWQKRFNQ